jgi:hypothetical protein
MTHLSPIQFETRRRQLGAELERESARVASRRVSPRPRRSRPVAQGRPGRRSDLGRRLAAAPQMAVRSRARAAR